VVLVDGGDHAAVDEHGLSGDPPGVGGGQEAHDGNDVDGVAKLPADRLRGEPGQSLIVLGPEEEAGLLRAWCDAVDGDPSGADLLGEGLREVLDRAFAASSARRGLL
jgi:hypothetical protein